MSAAAPFPSESRRPLGEVLVERGILTPDQLATALEQQRSTGQQLGEIIVASGFAPGPIVAQALATQHGGMMKTEYGYATGWSSNEGPTAVAPASSELAERDRTIAELHDWTEKAQAAIASRDDAIAQLRAELAERRAVPEPTMDHAAHEAALQALQSELTSRGEETAAVRAELEAETARHSSTRARLEQHAADIAQLEAALTELRDARKTVDHEVAAARRTNAELERRLENAGSRADTLARRVAEQEEELEAFRALPVAGPDRWASAPMHYVLRRGSGGYDLVAHDGPPPAVGDTVDGLRVARVGPAGPALDVPCAYLAD